jgi:adenosylcobinamide-GDP ribazoletransferase
MRRSSGDSEVPPEARVVTLDLRPPPSPATRAVRAVRLALAFLTIVPIASERDGEMDDADLAASRFAFPIVGALIGAVLAVVGLGLGNAHVDSGLAAFVLLAVWVCVSGGLHLDGLADTCDGLFLWGEPARRLEVMRDPRVGSFGVTAIVLVLLGKFAALRALDSGERAHAILAAAAIGRTLILLTAGVSRYARPDGTGRIIVEAATPWDACLACLVSLAIGAGAAGLTGFTAASVAIIVAWVIALACRRKLAGVTGDVLGAVVELVELAVVLSVGLFN